MKWLRVLGLSGLGLAGAVAAYVYAGAPPQARAAEPAAAASGAGSLQMLFRLTGEQYRNSIADIFGPDIKVQGRFDPQTRVSGLLAVGDSQGSVTPSGAEQYLHMARGIAAQVVDKDHRDELVGCGPANPKAMDEACASKFYARYGRLLFRRPLTKAELRHQLALTRASVDRLGDFHAGLRFGLVGLLTAPDFLFVQGLQAKSRDAVLDDYGKAARLSFFLWNTTPDEELLAAAERGELSTEAGRARQVDRLLASPRLEVGTRAFFSDLWALEELEETEKDPVIYPQYVATVNNDAKEETLRTIVDLLLTQKGDYRDLFTTRKSFLTRTLGTVYRAPVDVDADDGWAAYEFPPESGRSGVLTQISFLAPHSHPGRSSPTVRGKALRELLLCQVVPPPPPNVDFSGFETADPNKFKTTRAKISAHSANPVCASCHRLTDPVGLALENFDGAGTFRAAENGEPIDASGSLGGVEYKDAAGLGRAIHDNPQASACLVSRAYSYGVRRPVAPAERAHVDGLTQQFAKDGYRFTSLLRRLAMSDAFYRVPTQPSEKP